MNADDKERRAQDRAVVREIEELLRDARDKAHWLVVRRRHDLAAHIEHQCDATFLLAVDLRGRVTRGEPT
jgi:hypothetical protein